MQSKPWDNIFTSQNSGSSCLFKSSSLALFGSNSGVVMPAHGSKVHGSTLSLGYLGLWTVSHVLAVSMWVSFWFSTFSPTIQKNKQKKSILVGGPTVNDCLNVASCLLFPG